MPPALKPGGVSESFGPLGVTTLHSSTCAHCQHITDFESLRRMMDHVDVCRGCMRLICLKCVGQPCRPFEKEAERREAEARLRARLAADSWGCY